LAISLIFQILCLGQQAAKFYPFIPFSVSLGIALYFFFGTRFPQPLFLSILHTVFVVGLSFGVSIFPTTSFCAHPSPSPSFCPAQSPSKVLGDLQLSSLVPHFSRCCQRSPLTFSFYSPEMVSLWLSPPFFFGGAVALPNSPINHPLFLGPILFFYCTPISNPKTFKKN